MASSFEFFVQAATATTTVDFCLSCQRVCELLQVRLGL